MTTSLVRTTHTTHTNLPLTRPFHIRVVRIHGRSAVDAVARTFSLFVPEVVQRTMKKYREPHGLVHMIIIEASNKTIQQIAVQVGLEFKIFVACSLFSIRKYTLRYSKIHHINNHKKQITVCTQIHKTPNNLFW